ncbi:MAG: hypothetical protein LBE12_02890 [Planctomycetaceae bacterium]|jgi:DNA repair ATPase RecN|nr:hypothetical protein [Planctomycetaceae bacterium]
MATIAKLAIKISANIDELLKGASNVVRTIDNIAKITQNATPSMRYLGDSAESLGTLLEGVAEASIRVSEAFGNSDLNQEQIQEAINQYEKLQDITKNVYDAAVRNAANAADEIRKLPPTVRSVETAFATLRNAIDIREMAGLSAVGADLTLIENEVTRITESAGHVLKKMAAEIGQIEPSLDNTRVKIEKQIFHIIY